MAFASYLLALALLPFRWLTPIGGLQEHAQLTDVVVAMAAFFWLIERIRGRDLWRAFRTWQIPLAIYLMLSCVSAADAAAGFGSSWKTVLLMAELAVLAVITADFASEPGRRRLIARVIVASALATVALGVVALVLFYAHIGTGLVGSYGDLVPSASYARVRAGFDSSPLLASFCIFASGIAASKEAGLGTKLRITTQIGLGFTCLATISRGFLGFLFALVFRWSATLRGRRRIVVPVVTAAACVGIVAALTVGFLEVDPTKPSSISYSVPDARGHRGESLATSFTTLRDHPLLGIGPGALPGRNGTRRAHVTPVNVGATLGVPALIAFAAMFWLLWRGRLRPTEIALWSALAGMAIDGLANDIDHYRHLWVLIGLLGSSQARLPARSVPPEREPDPGSRTAQP